MRGKLLVIDDDRATRDAVQALFISRGWEVAMVDNQDGGLALLEEYAPDWVIVAWDQLRGTGGLFMRQVRLVSKEVRVALLTDAPTASEGILVQSLKPDARFAKPVIAEHIYRVCLGRQGHAGLAAV